jgi:hypothetical protein
MDTDEKNIEENNVNPELKNAVGNELSSYINPVSKTEAMTPSPEQTPVQRMAPIIRTFKGDVEETIQNNHLSSINIALAENKKMMERIQSAEKEQKVEKKNLTMIIITSVLVIGGILAITIPIFLINRQTNNQKSTTEIAPSEDIITADSEEKINLADIDLSRVAKTLSERVDQSSVRLGSIKDIYLTEGQGADEKVIGANKFLTLIKSHIPASILRTLGSSYMFGTHNFNGNQRFLIITFGSYDNAYSGMLSWEVDLWNDFKDIFALDDGSINNASTSNFGITVKTFQDAVYGNKDSRVVKDSKGKVLFLYSIINKNTAVITTSSDTLKEIISRVNNARVVTQ